MKQRHKNLIGILREKGELDIDTLVKLLEASPATVRRDLTNLEAAGKLIRTFGGAKLNAEPSLVVRTFEEKREVMRAEKERIAEKAAAMVKPGMVIAIDSGSTAWRLAAALKDKAPLTILTSALAVIEELGSVEGISINLTGGRFRLENLDFVGQAATCTFDNLHADIAFMSADSLIPEKGIYSLDQDSSFIGAAIGRCANRRVVMLDHSKIDSRGCYQILPSEQLNCVILSDGLNPEQEKRLKDAPFELCIA